MKKRGSLCTFILVVATLAAAAAIIVSHLDRIYDFLETCRKAAEEAGSRCRCGDGCVSQNEDESDFEDVEL